MSAYDVSDLQWGQTWPSLDTFRDLASQGYRVIPVMRRVLADALSPVGLYERLTRGRSGTFMLESAEYGASWSRYSFIGVHSVAQLRADNDGQAQWAGTVPHGVMLHGDVLDVLRNALDILSTPRILGVPNLTAGLVGTIGWSVISHWEESIAQHARQETEQPQVCLALASDVAVVDHFNGSLWLISNAINFDGSDERVDLAYATALEHIAAMQQDICSPCADSAYVSTINPDASRPELAFRTPQDLFESQVRAIQEHIVDGDAFQIVLSQRLDLSCHARPIDVYRVLRTLNPSPYMYIMTLSDTKGRDFHVIGSSPETLIKIDDSTAFTFPIAGSRPRGATPEEDEALKQDLLADPKEISEHVMLVDLARNDLSKVCDPRSVEVVSLMDVKRFSHIMHICSTVRGVLRDDVTALDAFISAFPAGTLSGAPKPSAISIINRIEPADRGIYGGTVGYFDFSGNLDMAIAIRTAIMRDGQASVQAGAGIVLDSKPHSEWLETRNKARASVEALCTAGQLVNTTQQH